MNWKKKFQKTQRNFLGVSTSSTEAKESKIILHKYWHTLSALRHKKIDSKIKKSKIKNF